MTAATGLSQGKHTFVPSDLQLESLQSLSSQIVPNVSDNASDEGLWAQKRIKDSNGSAPLQYLGAVWRVASRNLTEEMWTTAQIKRGNHGQLRGSPVPFPVLADPAGCSEDISNFFAGRQSLQSSLISMSGDCIENGSALDCAADIVESQQRLAEGARWLASSFWDCFYYDSSCAQLLTGVRAKLWAAAGSQLAARMNCGNVNDTNDMTCSTNLLSVVQSFSIAAKDLAIACKQCS